MRVCVTCSVSVTVPSFSMRAILYNCAESFTPLICGIIVPVLLFHKGLQTCIFGSCCRRPHGGKIQVGVHPSAPRSIVPRSRRCSHDSRNFDFAFAETLRIEDVIATMPSHACDGIDAGLDVSVMVTLAYPPFLWPIRKTSELVCVCVCFLAWFSRLYVRRFSSPMNSELFMGSGRARISHP